MKNIYINIAVVGSVNSVLNQILNKIDESGLYDACDKIFLVVNGDIKKLEYERKPKYCIWSPNSDISKCEFPTLDLMWTHAQTNDDIQMLYLHTKGVTKPGHQGIKDWTEYLTYFNVEKFEDRLKELKDYDAVGVSHGGNPDDYKEHPSTWGYGKAPLHFAGNFWWANSKHIKKLPNPISWAPDDNLVRWRVMCEMWVCCNLNGCYYGSWHSNVNHYTTLYPRDKYVIK